MNIKNLGNRIAKLTLLGTLVLGAGTSIANAQYREEAEQLRRNVIDNPSDVIDGTYVFAGKKYRVFASDEGVVIKIPNNKGMKDLYLCDSRADGLLDRIVLTRKSLSGFEDDLKAVKDCYIKDLSGKDETGRVQFVLDLESGLRYDRMFGGERRDGPKPAAQTVYNEMVRGAFKEHLEEITESEGDSYNEGRTR